MKTISISEWVAAAVNPARGSVSRSMDETSGRLGSFGRLQHGEAAAGRGPAERPSFPLFASVILLLGTLTTFAQVNRTIGTLPPGGTVTITFDVTVNSNMALGIYSVTNQGTVTANGVSTVLTDDPTTVAANDPTVTGLPPDLDFGDAPAPYPTLLANDGARHAIPFAPLTLFLGAVPPDFETNGQPHATAQGDNLNGTSDEDGVLLPAGFTNGQTATLLVVASASGKLDAWLDWNHNGSWADAGDRVLTNQSVMAGTNTFSVLVPSIPSNAVSFARFRLSTAGDLLFTGQADDGEVEDYQVNLVGTVPPAITCPTNVLTNAAPGACSQTVAFSATVTAGAPAPTVTYTIGATVITSPHVFPVGTNIVTVAATNGVAPDATCSFTVVVLDTQPPTVTAPANVAVSTGPGALDCSVVVSDVQLGSASSADNCSVIVVRSGVPAANRFSVGITPITYTATDSSGNTAIATQLVTVVDNTLPTITCPTNLIVMIETNATDAVVTYAVSALDNCSVVSTNSVPLSGSTFTLGTNTVNSVAVDAAGNSNTCSFLVIVHRRPIARDDTLGTTQNTPAAAPVAKLLANDSDLDGDTLSITNISATSTNGGSVAVITNNVVYTPVAGFLGVDRFTYTLADALGGTNTGTVIVTVTSTNAPSQNHVSLTITPNGRLVRFAGIPTQNYVIQAADDVAGPWADLSPPITAGPTGLVEYEDTTAPPPAVRFYRTTAVP